MNSRLGQWNRLVVLAAALGGSLGLANQCRAESYNVVILSSGAFSSPNPLAIADNGQIVGYDGNTAIYWANNSTTAATLPVSSQYTVTVAHATSGTQIGGYSLHTVEHALLWSSPSAVAIDLNPQNFQSSLIQAMTGTQEVGWGTAANSSNANALLWNGTSPNATNLNPAGFTNSYAYAISGNLVGGMGASASTGGNEHALLWNTTSNSFQDLNPSGYTTSDINSISGNQEAGYAYTASGDAHAVVWNGSTPMDLNPQGFAYSRAEATNGDVQVGFASTADNALSAFVWSGSATSAVNLNQFLPSGYTGSIAYGVNANGDIVGIGTGPGQSEVAIEWIPVPAPAPFAAILALSAGCLVAYLWSAVKGNRSTEVS